MKLRKRSVPDAGTCMGDVTLRMRSGGPSCQSTEKTGGLGASAASPSGIPASTHDLISIRSSAERRRLSAKLPKPGSGSQGGM